MSLMYAWGLMSFEGGGRGWLVLVELSRRCMFMSLLQRVLVSGVRGVRRMGIMFSLLNR